MDPSVEGVDIISSMPDEILHHILSFIPTQDAIRTSALSKAWRHVWCHIPCLDFDFCDKYRLLQQTKTPDINQTLSFYRAPKITSFNLRIPRHVRGPEINSCIEFAVSRNVEKLTLVFQRFSNHDFQKIFYRSSSLTQLYIRYFDMIPRCTVSWKSLRKLKLRNCKLYGKSIGNILSGSPILETLELKYCRGPRRLDLSKSPSLRRLVIYLGTRPTEIVAPHLHYLSLETFNKGPCSLVDVSSLVEARIHIVVDNYGPPLKLDFLQTMVLKLLGKLQNVKRLTFTGTVLQILSLVELRAVPFPTFKVQTLTVETRFTRSVIPGLARLLQNSPELEKLIAHATRLFGIPDRDLDRYMDSEGLNADQCGRSKYEAFPTLIGLVSVISCKDATWRLMASFMEMVMRNVKALETLVLGLEHIEPHVSDARWFEELLQMLQLLSNNNNVSNIVLKR